MVCGRKETGMMNDNILDGEGEGQGQGLTRLSQVSGGFLTINLNGWFTKVRRPEGRDNSGSGSNQCRYHALFSAIKRHKFSLVGVQEHHWGSLSKSEEARQWLIRKGWSMRETCGSGREGVAILWKSSEWAEVESWALHPRLLIVELSHASGDRLVFMVGHLHSEPGIRQKQWELLGKFCRKSGVRVDVSLCDHNSVLHAGATSRWNASMGTPEKKAIDSEDGIHLEWRLLDAWDTVHGADPEYPGYTHSYHREDVVIERRIDRIMVAQDLAAHLGSTYIIPIGFSDHMGVACWLRGVGEDQEGEKRWKFNLAALNDPQVVEKIRSELEGVSSNSFSGWERGIHILRKNSLKFSALQSERSPIWKEVCQYLRESHQGYVPRGAWQLFHRVGVQASTMSDAFNALNRLMVEEEHTIQKGLALDALRDALHTHDSLVRARRQRDKAVARMIKEIQSRRTIATLQNRQGHIVSGGLAVAEVLKDFWQSVTPPHLPQKDACKEWLQRLPLPSRWKTLVPSLIRPRTEEVLLESLKRMDGSAAPGEDGIWAACYQAFPEFFANRLEEIFKDLENGAALPPEWTISCVRPIPKKPGAVKPEDQRPIALQQCKVKWVMMTILVQIEDAMAQLVPPQQKAYLRGRRMEDHLLSVMATWETPPNIGMGEAWLAIDYSKAFDSVNHGLVEALLNFIQLPSFMVRICLSVMKGAIVFLVGRRLVREVELQPMSGIRQGDPLSPVIFVLLTSLLLFIKRRDDCTFWLYSDDTLIRVIGSQADLKGRVEGILEFIHSFGQWSGLRINMAKTELLLKGVPQEANWHGLRIARFIKYLGGYIGDIEVEKSFAPSLIKVHNRCCWLSTAPLCIEEKKLLIHSWVFPCLRIPALLRLAPESIQHKVTAGVRMALNLKPWRMSMEIYTLTPQRGGVGVIHPKVCLDWTLAQSFWRWTKDDTVLPPKANTLFREWVKKRGISLEPPNLPLIRMAGAPRIQVPWLVQSVRAWSRLMGMLPGVKIRHADLARTPLWHNKLFEVGGCTRACNPIIAKGVVSISHVVDLSEDGTPDFTIPEQWKKPLHMTLPDQIFYQEALQKIQKAHRNGVGVERKGAGFENAAMSNPLSMSLCVSSGSKQEKRQPQAVWKIFHRICLPGSDKDFIRQALWGKLSVASRLHFIFPDLPQWCPLDFAVEDHHHRLKSCSFLQLPTELLRRCLPFVLKDGRQVEVGRLCVDEPELSLTTPQGLLMWKIIRTLWVYRCSVMFKGEQVHQVPFMAMLRDGLKWWMKEEVLAVPLPLVSCFISGVEGWLTTSAMPPLLPFASSVNLVHRKRKRQSEITTPPPPPAPGEDEARDQAKGLWKKVFTDGSFAWESAGVGFAGAGFCVEGEPAWDTSLHLPGDLQTNNRAELFAVIMAVETLPQEWPLQLISDSSYVVKGIKERFGGPRAIRKIVRLVANEDLWNRLEKSLSKRLPPWEVEWTRGHVGLPGNERADRLANEGRMKHPSRILWQVHRQKPPIWMQWDDPSS